MTLSSKTLTHIAGRMKLRGAFTILATLMLPALVCGARAQSIVSPPRSDNQFWNETQIVKHLNEKRDLVFIGVIRIGRDWHRPVDERAGMGYAIKVNPHLTIMPTYLFVSYQPFPGRLINEHRLVMNVTGKFNLSKFTFTDRNLFERRVRHSNPDFSVYRNRLQIDHPARLGSFEFKPFVADEVWYSTQTVSGRNAGWFRNRISAGILKQFTKHFYGEFFYLHQNDGLSRPGNINVIGTFFRYTL